MAAWCACGAYGVTPSECKDWCAEATSISNMDDRLDRVEAKVDLLLAHFGLTEEEEEG